MLILQEADCKSRFNSPFGTVSNLYKIRSQNRVF